MSIIFTQLGMMEVRVVGGEYTWVVQIKRIPPPQPISWLYQSFWMVMISTAYAVLKAQLPATVMRTCSFMLNGPGLKNWDLGMAFSMILPMGILSNWTTRGEICMAFRLYQKNWLTKPIRQAKMMARDHIRKVLTGSVGSSVLVAVY